MRHLFYVSLVVLTLGLLFSGIASAQDVLRLDADKSYVANLDTGGTKTYYIDFLGTDQFEGHKLEFIIYVHKVEKAYIPDEYVLKLETNMENPEWKFGDEIRSAAEWIVWKGKEEHEYERMTILVTGEVPKGIGNGEVYVTLTVGTTKDGKTLETIIQRLEPSMEFSSTNKAITPTPSITPTPTIPPEEKLYSIFIISAVMIVLIFSIFISIRLKHRMGRKKIERYKTKMHEWEKEGYDVSELKEVLEDEK